MPFEDSVIRNLKFEKHRNEFSFSTAQQYEAEADALWLATPPHRCERASGPTKTVFDSTGQTAG